MEDISHYKDIVEYQSELISRWTPEGKITYVNRAYCEYFGKSKEELIGQDIKDFIPVEDRKIFLEYLGTFNKENLEGSIVHKNIDKFGRINWQEWWDKAIVDDEGNIVEFQSVGRDITHQKNAELALEQVNLELEQRIEERTRNLQQEIEHRKSVEKKLQRQMHHLDVMRQIDKHIIANRDLNETMQRIVDFSIQQLDVDAAQIVLKQSFLQSFEQVAVGGELCEKIKEIHHKLDYEQFAEVIKNKNMIAIPDLRDGPEWFPNRQLFIANGLNSYFNVPLVIEGDLKGFFIVIRSKDEQPDEEWFHYLESFAGQAVIAVDSTILFWELLQLNSEMTIAYDTTLEGWAKVLEIRDYETAGHTYRVTDLTITLASLMGFNSDELAHIYRGAVLHDIGKMGIPDKILLKEGPLTEAERMIINQHPQFAYDMLYEITYLVPAIDIPFCHHEKWDGSGYPRGIAGMEIPRAARIFAVVDVYDALTSDRPYRKAWPVEKTLKYIEVESGKHFDPEIVDVVLNYLQKSIPHTD